MEDIKIVELFLNRIEPTIQETHLKYGKLCKKIAFNLLFNNEDAEEVLNDTYLGVWDSIPPENPVYLISEISESIISKLLQKDVVLLDSQVDAVLGDVYDRRIASRIVFLNGHANYISPIINYSLSNRLSVFFTKNQ